MKKAMNEASSWFLVNLFLTDTVPHSSTHKQRIIHSNSFDELRNFSMKETAETHYLYNFHSTVHDCKTVKKVVSINTKSIPKRNPTIVNMSNNRK